MHRNERFTAGFLLILFLLALTCTAAFFLTPQMSPESIEQARQQFPAWSQQSLLPENQESASFFWGIFTLPLWMLLAYLAVRRIPALPAWFERATLFFFAVFAAIATLSNWQMDYPSLVRSLSGAMIVVIAATAIGLGYFLVAKRDSDRRGKIYFVIGILMLILQVFTTRIYFPEYVNYVDRMHFGVISQAISIATTGVFAPSQYGFYPYFLLPVFTVAGHSVIKVSLVMGALYLLEMAILLYVLQKLLVRKILVMAAAGALVTMYSLASLHAGDFDPYFQYHPIRSFLLCVAVLLAYLTCKGGQAVKSGIVAGILSGAALFWNIDSGVVVAIGLGVWFGWNAFCRRDRQWYYAVAAYSAMFLFTISSLFGLFSWWNGAPLEFGELLRIQTVFYIAGYGMLPIPAVIHAWIVVALLYVFALCRGAWRIRLNPNGCRGQIEFLIGLFGIGLFLYYQGRSSFGNLASVAFLALYPMVLLIDEFSARIMRKGWKTPVAPLWLVLLLGLSALLGTFFYDLPTFGKLTVQVAGRFAERKAEYYDDILFIRHHAPKDGIANILGVGQGFYSIETDLTPGFVPFNQVEMFRTEEYRRLLANLVACQRPIFLTARKFVYEWEPPETFLEHFFVLRAVSASGRVRYYEPKPIN